METIIGIVIATALTNGISAILSHPITMIFVGSFNNDNQKTTEKRDEIKDLKLKELSVNSINKEIKSAFVICQNCNTRIIPKSDKKCPNCGSNLQEVMIMKKDNEKKYADLILEHKNKMEEANVLKNEIISKRSKKYYSIFITIDVVLHAIVGYMIGINTGYFFYGIAFRKHYWPGIIAIALASFYGASNFTG